MKLSIGLLSILSAVSLNFASGFVPLATSPSNGRGLALGAGKDDAADVAAVRSAVGDLVKEKNCGPILIRLAWHDAGTYKKEDGSGGPRGCMRFEKVDSVCEANFGANNGLDVARLLLASMKEDLAPNMSFADFWALASIVAIKEM